MSGGKGMLTCPPPPGPAGEDLVAYTAERLAAPGSSDSMLDSLTFDQWNELDESQRSHRLYSSQLAIFQFMAQQSQVMSMSMMLAEMNSLREENRQLRAQLMGSPQENLPVNKENLVAQVVSQVVSTLEDRMEER